MKVSYDPGTDTLSVVLKEGVPVSQSDEDKRGVILDYDDDGDLVSLEILDASRRVTETRKIEFWTTEPPKTAQGQAAQAASPPPITSAMFGTATREKPAKTWRETGRS